MGLTGGKRRTRYRRRSGRGGKGDAKGGAEGGVCWCALIKTYSCASPEKKSQKKMALIRMTEGFCVRVCGGIYGGERGGGGEQQSKTDFLPSFRKIVKFIRDVGSGRFESRISLSPPLQPAHLNRNPSRPPPFGEAETRAGGTTPTVKKNMTPLLQNNATTTLNSVRSTRIHYSYIVRVHNDYDTRTIYKKNIRGSIEKKKQRHQERKTICHHSLITNKQHHQQHQSFLTTHPPHPPPINNQLPTTNHQSPTSNPEPPIKPPGGSHQPPPLIKSSEGPHQSPIT